MRTRNLVVAFVVASGTIATALVATGPAQETQRARTPRLERESAKYVSTSQYIKPLNPRLKWSDERIIASKIPGRIKSRNVDEGSRVSVADTLAVLDDEEAQVEYSLQEILANSDLAQRIQYAKVDEFRIRRDEADELAPSRAIPKQERRLAYVNVQVNELQAKQEEEKRELEKLKYKRAEVILREHTIKSPMKGIVQKCFKRAGESVTLNESEMFRIIATDQLWVEGLVPATDAYRVREGQRVTVQLVFRDENREVISVPQSRVVFEGEVTFIDPDIDQVSGWFWVRAEVANQTDATSGREILRAGLPCEMTIWLEPGEGNKPPTP